MRESTMGDAELIERSRRHLRAAWPTLRAWWRRQHPTDREALRFAAETVGAVLTLYVPGVLYALP